jgi:hypothetical protein
MLGKRNIRDSIGYVTLGLFTHTLLDELLEVKKKPAAPPERRKMIDLASDSLKAIEAPHKIDSLRWKNLLFQNYQEMRTLRSVLSCQQEVVGSISDLREILSAIVKPDSTEDERIKETDKALRFFAELANMAVINTECPEERVPPGVRQLVS